MAPIWSENDIPDLAGTTAVVTGANRGIGFEVARGLAAKRAHVVLAVRRGESGRAAAAAIRTMCSDASLDVVEIDLANLASVHRFAAALGSRLDAVDLLINNAGLGSAALRRTVDGFELVFGTNHLAHFALTGLLLPAMIVSPTARVITVASMAHATGRIDFDNLDGSKGYREFRAYAQSKLANVLFAYELQRRLSAAGAATLSIACHPGWAATNMGVEDHRRPQDRLLHWVTTRIAPTAAQGARPVLFAATSPEAGGGDYVGPGGSFGVSGSPASVRSSDLSHDQELARRLWEVSEEMTGVRYSFVAAGMGSAAAGGRS